MRVEIDSFAVWCGMLLAAQVSVLLWTLYEVWR